MTLILAILNAVAAIPTMKELLDMAIAAYIASQDAKRRQLIQDSYTDLVKAKTQDEKDAALLKRFNAGKS